MQKTKPNHERRRKVKRETERSVKVDQFKMSSQKIVMFKQIVPPRVITKLRFLCNRLLNNAGLNSASIQMRANGLFDPDPLVLSNTVPGFTTWSTFFQRNRVLQVKSTLNVVNKDTSIPYLINLAFEPIFFAANAKVLADFENPLSKTRIVGASSYSQPLITIEARAVDIVGDNEPLEGGNYVGSPTANPTALFYASVSADCSANGGGTVMVNGLLIRWELEFIVEFFERLTQL